MGDKRNLLPGNSFKNTVEHHLMTSASGLEHCELYRRRRTEYADYSNVNKMHGFSHVFHQEQLEEKANNMNPIQMSYDGFLSYFKEFMSGFKLYI